MTEKRKAMLQIAGIVAAFVLLVVGTIFYKSLWLRIPFAIMAIGVGALLVRMYLSYRGKSAFDHSSQEQVQGWKVHGNT